MIGKYVKYKHLSYLVCGVATTPERPYTYSKVHIIKAGSQKKLQVNVDSVSLINCEPAKQCMWQDGKYLVTGKGNILSLKTMRWMEWPEMHGGRIELLKQAGLIQLAAGNNVSPPMAREKRCYQCDKLTSWLAPDARCGKCTRMTPEEVRGECEPA